MIHDVEKVDDKTFLVTLDIQPGDFNINALIFPGAALPYNGQNYTIKDIEVQIPLQSYKVTVE